MSGLSPASDKCYAEALLQITKIEKRFDEEQKQKWELKRKESANEAGVKKEMYKAMGRISSNYQPSSGNTTIITR